MNHLVHRHKKNNKKVLLNRFYSSTDSYVRTKNMILLILGQVFGPVVWASEFPTPHSELRVTGSALYEMPPGPSEAGRGWRVPLIFAALF